MEGLASWTDMLGSGLCVAGSAAIGFLLNPFSRQQALLNLRRTTRLASSRLPSPTRTA